jgi:pimeloyl-ACP methyl ester carboxylesterase
MARLSGVRLVVVDRPGFGLSGGFDYRRVDLRQHALAFLESVLDALGIERAAFVANSMGGLWSFWLALDRPERVTRLAQLGSPALMTDTSATGYAAALGAWAEQTDASHEEAEPRAS